MYHEKLGPKDFFPITFIVVMVALLHKKILFDHLWMLSIFFSSEFILVPNVLEWCSTHKCAKCTSHASLYFTLLFEIQKKTWMFIIAEFLNFTEKRPQCICKMMLVMACYNDYRYMLFIFISQVVNVFIVGTLKMQTKVKNHFKITFCTIFQKFFPSTLFYAIVELFLYL